MTEPLKPVVMTPPNPATVAFVGLVTDLAAGVAPEFGQPWDGPMVPLPGRSLAQIREDVRNVGTGQANQVKVTYHPGGYRMDPRDERLLESAARQCTSKKRYACKKDAITAAAGAMSRRRNRPKMLRAYPCAVCQGWHLTSKPLRE